MRQFQSACEDFGEYFRVLRPNGQKCLCIDSIFLYSCVGYLVFIRNPLRRGVSCRRLPVLNTIKGKVIYSAMPTRISTGMCAVEVFLRFILHSDEELACFKGQISAEKLLFADKCIGGFFAGKTHLFDVVGDVVAQANLIPRHTIDYVSVPSDNRLGTTFR